MLCAYAGRGSMLNVKYFIFSSRVSNWIESFRASLFFSILLIFRFYIFIVVIFCVYCTRRIDWGPRDSLCVNTAICLVIHFTKFRGYIELLWAKLLGSQQNQRDYIRKKNICQSASCFFQPCELIVDFDFNREWRTLVSIDKQRVNLHESSYSFLYYFFSIFCVIKRKQQQKITTTIRTEIMKNDYFCIQSLIYSQPRQ